MAPKSKKETFSPKWEGFSPEEVKRRLEARTRLLKLIEEMSPEEKAEKGYRYEIALKNIEMPSRVIKVTQENRAEILRNLK